MYMIKFLIKTDLFLSILAWMVGIYASAMITSFDTKGVFGSLLRAGCLCKFSFFINCLGSTGDGKGKHENDTPVND